MTKVCSKCGVEKDIEEFTPNKKNTDGRNGTCKKCVNIKAKEMYQKRRRASGHEVYADRPVPPEGYKYCPKCKQILPLDDFHMSSNSVDGRSYSCKVCWNLRGREFHGKNKERVNAKHREYYNKNATEIIERQKAYQDARKEQTAKKSHQWYVNNKERVQANAKRLAEIRPDVRVRRALRARIVHALQDNYKSAKTMELIGCDIDFLRSHLESQFLEGMTWNNYGVKTRSWEDTWWVVDHIRPCATFDMSNPDDQKICFHWTNLQPMWWRENIVKGDKWSEQDQIEWEKYIASLKKEQSTHVSA